MAWRTWATIAILAAVGPACAPKKRSVHPVVSLAPFDLDCARKKLRYTRLNADTMGVRGCGKKAKYVRVCRTRNPGTIFQEDVCQWVQN